MTQTGDSSPEPLANTGWGNALPLNAGSTWIAHEGLIRGSAPVAGGEELDLSSVPATSVELTLDGNSYSNLISIQPPKYTIKLGSEIARLVVRIEDGRQVDITIHHSRVDLDVCLVASQSRPGRITGLGTPIKRLTVDGAHVEVDPIPYDQRRPGNKVIDYLLLTNGTLQTRDRPFNIVELSGDVQVEFSSSNIGTLQLAPALRAKVVTGKCVATRPIQVSRKGLLDKSPAALLPGTRLAVERIGLDEVSLSSGAELVGQRSFSNLTIRGSGTIRVCESAEDLAFADSGPELLLERYAQLVSASGSVRLGSARDALLSGVENDATRQLVLVGIGADPGEVAGARIMHFAVAVDLTGIEMLARLQREASQLTPLVHSGLPGMGYGQRMQLRAPNGERLRDRRPSVSPIEQEYASAISSACHVGGSPASTRTMLAWCAYRVRHMASKSNVEKITLSGYRMIGYGERPAPAFLTYALLALIATMFTMVGHQFRLDIHGLWNWFVAYLNWLIAPLHILNVNATSSSGVGFGQPWDTMARLLITVPFATAVLALRKYVKYEGP